MNKGINIFKKIIRNTVIFILSFLLLADFASAIIYNPGETLNPACAPADANCDVALITSTFQPLIATGTVSQYFRGDLSLANFPTLLSDFVNDLNFISNIFVSGPISGAGTSTSPLTMLPASSSTDGYLTSADWNIFDSKLASTTLDGYLSTTTAASTYLTQVQAAFTYVTQPWAYTTFPTYSYASTTYAMLSSLSSYLSTTSASENYVATSTLADTLLGFVSTTTADATYIPYSYASSTYYLASNPAGYLTSYTETDPLFMSASTSLPYISISSSSDFYLSSNPSGYISSTTDALINYPTYNYASSTYLSIIDAQTNYVSTSTASSTYLKIADATSALLSYEYASSTFPTFTYASSTFATYEYASSTFLTINSAIADYVSTSTLSNTLLGYLSTTSASENYVATSTLADTLLGYVSTSSANALYVNYDYASSTFPSFEYASSTFATIASSSQWTTNETSIYYNGGNVGIGTSTPSEHLTVIGNILANQYGTPYYVNLVNSSPAVVDWDNGSIQKLDFTNANVNNTVAYYKFENNLNDEMGGTPGSASNMSYLESASAGGLDGGEYGIRKTATTSGDAVSLSYSNINRPEGAVEFAFNTGGNTSGIQTILWLGGSAAPSSRAIEFGVINARASARFNDTGFYTSTKVLSLNTWYYGVVTWSTTDNITKFWVGDLDISDGSVSDMQVFYSSTTIPLWGTVNANVLFNGFNGLDKFYGDGFDSLRYSNVALSNFPTTDSFIDIPVTISNPVIGAKYIINTVNDAFGRVRITWPASIVWIEGIEGNMRTISNAEDTFELVWDGTNYLARHITTNDKILSSIRPISDVRNGFNFLNASGTASLLSIDYLNNKIGIGTTTPSEALTVVGNIYATGTITGSNLSGINTGDESSSTIRTKIGVASSTNDGYLSAVDWVTFSSALSTTSANALYVNYEYASSTFPSFEYASSTFATYEYASSTFLTIDSAIADYVSTSTFSDTLLGYISTTSAESTYAKLDGTNQPFTGNINISTSSPELRLTDGSYAVLTKISSGNKFVLSNQVSAFTEDGTGGTITHSDGYTIHTFTSNDVFVPSSAGNIELLVVGGGGGGGGGWQGGGGGAGGLIYDSSYLVSVQDYPVIVGAGGIGANNTNDYISTAGASSSFGNIITTGGGRGGGEPGGNLYPPTNGGSGGGGSHPSNCVANVCAGALGIPGQGYDGGDGWTGNPYAGGGGGGAGGVGTDAIPAISKAGDGGPGLTYSISGTSTGYAGGGGGSIRSGTQGVGTHGGGSFGTSGTANTGGGGGASAGFGNAGDGGSGVVIVKYLSANANQVIALINSEDSSIGGEYGINTFGATLGATHLNGNTLYFDINGTTKLKVDSSGNLGIGTTTPSQALTVVGNIFATGTITGSNLSGINTGDESSSTIRTKIGVASSTNDGYLSAADWATFSSALSTTSANALYVNYEYASSTFPSFEYASNTFATGTTWWAQSGSSIYNKNGGTVSIGTTTADLLINSSATSTDALSIIANSLTFGRGLSIYNDCASGCGGDLMLLEAKNTFSGDLANFSGGMMTGRGLYMNGGTGGKAQLRVETAFRTGNVVEIIGGYAMGDGGKGLHIAIDTSQIATGTVYGLDVAKSGVSSTSIGARFSATDGTVGNYAIIVPSNGGTVGIGTTTPTDKLVVIGTSTTDGLKITGIINSLLGTDASGNVIATSTNLSNYMTFAYGSSTFPSFEYASSTFATYEYASSTFPSFEYASSTYLTDPTRIEDALGVDFVDVENAEFPNSLVLQSGGAPRMVIDDVGDIKIYTPAAGTIFTAGYQESNSSPYVTSCSSAYSAEYDCWMSADNNTGTRWSSAFTGGVGWFKIDFLTAKTATQITFKPYSGQVNGWNLQGSNDGSSWTTLITDAHPNDDTVQTETFVNVTPYRYYLFNITSSYAGYQGLWDFDLIGNTSSLLTNVIDGTTGYLGLGTSSASSRLDIFGKAGSEDILRISSSSGSRFLTMTSGGSLILGTSSSPYLLQVYVNGSVEGHVVTETGAWANTSDERLKKNITTLESDTLDKLMQLNAVRYDSINDISSTTASTTGLKIGFIAQELEEIYPEFVDTNSMTGYKSISYANMVPILLKGIQEIKNVIGDISTSTEGLLSLAEQIKTETERSALDFIMNKINSGAKMLTDFVATRITAIRGYFDEVFVKKVHTEQICLKKADGSEACIDGDKLQEILNQIGVEASQSGEIPVIEESSSTENIIDTSTSTEDTTTTTIEETSSSTEESVSSTPITPQAPNVTNDDEANTLSGMDISMEYDLDGAGYLPYGDGNIFNAIDFSGDHILSVRISAEGINPAGEVTTLTFTTN